MSQVTTHVIDTTTGKTAPGISVTLYHLTENNWAEIAVDMTNMEGRVNDLLPKEIELEHGTYKLRFETKFYFEQLEMKTFYPFVEIVFLIDSNAHFHIPLLISPFGYTTYRGS